MLRTDLSVALLARGESFSSLIKALDPRRDVDADEEGPALLADEGLSNELGRWWLAVGGRAPMLAKEIVDRLLGGR